jgi:hypothetical protein
MIDINWNPSKRELRQFAAMLLVFMGVVGGVVLYRTGSLQAAAWVWGPALGVGTVGLAAPRAIKYLYVGWICAAFPIGWTISHLLLLLIFYGILTPIGLVMRVLGYDPLRRKSDPAAGTYWVERAQAEDSSRYFSQF